MCRQEIIFGKHESNFSKEEFTCVVITWWVHSLEHVVDKVRLKLIDVERGWDLVVEWVVKDLTKVSAEDDAVGIWGSEGKVVDSGVKLVLLIWGAVILEESDTNGSDKIEETGEGAEFGGDLLSEVSSLAVGEDVGRGDSNVWAQVEGSEGIVSCLLYTSDAADE